MKLAGKRMPSESLLRRLQAEGFGTRAELEACAPFVRSLAQDLPDFDSVWLDAMVQLQILTPWQADQLLDRPSESLTVGPCLRHTKLGAATCLAFHRQQKKFVVLRSLRLGTMSAPETMTARVSELRALLDRLKVNKPGSVLLPTDVATLADGTPALIAPYVPGWTLHELLIRGGRLPWPVVAEIGRELLDALVWYEGVRLIHGDIVSSNVILGPSGHVSLVDPFARRLESPHAALRSDLTLRDCDGLAPELFGTGRPADIRSEIYALGCLLWHLLTSRPVVLNADPVARMMKLKEQDVVDVRTFVPDCPEWMARLIQSMTRRTPELRPTSAADVARAWKAESGDRRIRCRRLAAEMPDVTLRREPKLSVVRRRKSALWPMTACLVLAAVTIAMVKPSIVPIPLRFQPWADASASKSETAAPVAARPQQGPQPLPTPDGEGNVRLQAGLTYIAGRIDGTTTLRITTSNPLENMAATSSVATVIVPAGKQWILNAPVVELNGIRVRRDDESHSAGSAEVPAAPGTSPRQLLAIQCGSLSIHSCEIQSPSDLDSFVGLAWFQKKGTAGVVVLQDCIFSGGGYGLSLNHPPERLELNNVLLSNRGSGLLCEFTSQDQPIWQFQIQNVTQRFGFSLADVVVHADGPSKLQLTMTGRDSVLQPGMSVVRVHPGREWTSSDMDIRFLAESSGNPVLLPPSTEPVVYVDRTLGQPVALSEEQIPECQLLFAELDFDTESSAPDSVAAPSWAGAVLRGFEGPSLTTALPGIIPERLPR